MLYPELIPPLQEFRQSLYELFANYGDTLMDLNDALSGSTNNARSVVELSLSPLFRRGYSAF